jgi:hypothetical protein
MIWSSLRWVACVGFAVAIGAPAIVGQDYKADLPLAHPAIEYERGPVSDPVARLASDIEQSPGASPPRTDLDGYLPDLLARLQINQDSQMLVFSKTSVQAARISPDHPRAIYFGDEVVVAHVPGAPSLELAGIDPVRGPVFYAMSLSSSGAPVFTRSTTCLRCHRGPNTAGVPGLYVGSVIPGPTGAPLRDDSAVITDHRSAFAERWGGWFVTARRGEQPDRANAVASDPARPETLLRESRQNLTSLAGRFEPAGYLALTSDIVALMVFEHQTQMTNLITRVGWQARMAAADGNGSAMATAALDADVDELVSYMLFGGEARLTVPVEGVSTFTRTFPQRGPRDRQGRSLRDFDLRTRLFRYPLSYMIYSRAFGALPDAVQDRIYRRLYDLLTAPGSDSPAATVSRADRTAILEIVRDTKPNVPAYWRAR